MPLQHICWMVNNMKTINELVNMHIEDVYAAIKSGKVDKDTFLEFIEYQSDDAYSSGLESANIDFEHVKNWAKSPQEALDQWEFGYEAARNYISEMVRS